MIKKTKKGFSLVEVLVSIGIMGLLLVSTVVVLSNLNNKEVLEKSALAVKSVLEKARSQTTDARNDSVYGVRIEDNRVILFAGGTYSVSDPRNEVEQLSLKVKTGSIALSGGGSDIVFKRISGETDNDGNFKLYLLKDLNKFKNISVTRTGIITAY